MHVSPKLAEDYLNTLMSEFDKDGITDRQREYERTIEFVDTRSVFLSSELKQIELRKQKFKENNLSSITVDAEKALISSLFMMVSCLMLDLKRI